MQYKLALTVQTKPPTRDFEHLAAVRNALHAELMVNFCDYGPKLDFGGITFRNANRALFERLHEILDKHFDCTFAVEARASVRELERARYVWFGALGDAIDLDDDTGDPLNEYVDVLCPACGWRDPSKPPEPYRVQARQMREQEIYYADCAMKIVSRAFRERWSDWLEPWCDFGPAEVVGRPKTKFTSVVLENEWYWLRPREEVSCEVRAVIDEYCKICGRPIKIRKALSDDPFENVHHIVNSWDHTEAPIVRVGNWYGQRKPGREMAYYSDQLISGKLYGLMRAANEKGLVRPSVFTLSEEEWKGGDPWCGPDTTLSAGNSG